MIERVPLIVPGNDYRSIIDRPFRPDLLCQPSPMFFGQNQAAPAGGVGGEPGGVAPSDLSGLQAWWRATAITGLSSGDDITTWNDSSGNSRNATGVLRNTHKPRWKSTDGPDSLPAVLFIDAAGEGGHFTVPNFLNPAAYTAGNVFWVSKLVFDPPNSADSSAPACGDWGTTNDAYWPYTDGKLYDDFGSNARKDAIVTGTSLTAWILYEGRTAAGAWSCHINGVQKHTTASNTVAWGTSPFLGRVSGSAKFLRGWVSDIIFYSRVLSSSERWNTVHTYLNNKYPSFSLPTS